MFRLLLHITLPLVTQFVSTFSRLVTVSLAGSSRLLSLRRERLAIFKSKFRVETTCAKLLGVRDKRNQPASVCQPTGNIQLEVLEVACVNLP